MHELQQVEIHTKNGTSQWVPVETEVRPVSKSSKLIDRFNPSSPDLIEDEDFGPLPSGWYIPVVGILFIIACAVLAVKL